jgi:hypothetical protein
MALERNYRLSKYDKQIKSDVFLNFSGDDITLEYDKDDATIFLTEKKTKEFLKVAEAKYRKGQIYICCQRRINPSNKVIKNTV